MKQNKNNIPIWNTRISKNSSTIFKKFGSSIDIDKRLYKEDIQASIIHTEMLFKQKIISFKIKNKIIWGLNKIRNEILKKKFIFNKNYEDIHINIEKRLFEVIGDDAGFVLDSLNALALPLPHPHNVPSVLIAIAVCLCPVVMLLHVVLVPT